MIWSAIILLMFSILAFVIYRVLIRKINGAIDKYKINDLKQGIQISKIAWITLASMSALFFISSCFTIVSTGNIGVPTFFSEVKYDTISEGLSLRNPFYRIHDLPIRTQTYTMVSTTTEGAKQGDDSIYTQSLDGVVMNMDVTIAYRLIPSDAPYVYKYFGNNYAENIVRTVAKSALPDITSKFSFQDAYTVKRDEIGAKVLDRMNTLIKNLISEQTGLKNKQGIIVQSVLLRKIAPPPQIKAAIEEKMAAEQRAEQMKYVLQKEKQEAERKRIEAQGIQDFQTIVSRGINENLLKWKGIEATEQLAKSPNSKVVIIGGKDGLPIILNDK